jgi:uncharacterized protein YdeI (YjbR/CyaY-like superfamily)
MSARKIKSFYPKNRKQWRKWLEKNHDKVQSVWLICYKMKSGTPTITCSEAVDEALCFGWIDSTRKSIDDEKFMQFFSKRKTGSTWSKINKEKIRKLIDDRRMAQAGFASIEAAKQNGSWTILDEVEALVIPDDLRKEFKTKPGSNDFFMGLSKSARKAILQWLVLAKQQQTRQKRIIEITQLASKNMRPKQFR